LDSRKATCGCPSCTAAISLYLRRDCSDDVLLLSFDGFF
jgi:hypothetical protein